MTNIEDIVSELARLPRTTFGISVPALRQTARRIARDDYRILLDNSRLETFELRLLNALMLGYARDDLPHLLDCFARFVPYVDDWAVCDALCQGFTAARCYPEPVWDFVMQYRNSRQEFAVRIVAVVLLSHYLNDEYIDRVMAVLDSLYTEKYYAQMGVAWALATLCAKYPEKCLQYLRGPNNLDATTFRMTIRKINESFRVAPEVKRQALLLRGLK